MTLVVIDASAGVEIVCDRLGGWHLRHASVAPLVQAAWNYRHNLTAADALYVALAEQLGASLLTDDHRLAQAPTFPSHVSVAEFATYRREEAWAPGESESSPWFARGSRTVRTVALPPPLPLAPR